MQKKIFFLLMLSLTMLTGCFSSKSKETVVSAPTSTKVIENTEENVPGAPGVTTLSVSAGSSGGLAQINNSLSGNFILSNVSVGGL